MFQAALDKQLLDELVLKSPQEFFFLFFPLLTRLMLFLQNTFSVFVDLGVVLVLVLFFLFLSGDEFTESSSFCCVFLVPVSSKEVFFVFHGCPLVLSKP